MGSSAAPHNPPNLPPVSRLMQSRFIPEIDLLRGLAVVMMIANHAGNQFTAEADLASGAPHLLVQFGSFAPVLFFFATGLGIGFQSALGRHTSRAVLKMSVLIAADIILAVAAVGQIRFDFLSFIGVSTLICALVARTRHSETVSVVGFLFVVALRFVTAPLSRFVGVTLDASFANVVLGVYPVRGFAYPLSPWLCFPLLGYYLAHRVPRIKERGELQYTKFLTTLLVAGILAIAISAVAVNFCAAFHRWGTVSAAFFVAAVGVALLTLGIFGLIERRANTAAAYLVKGLKIRGIACLAIVPIHYVLIESLCAHGIQCSHHARTSPATSRSRPAMSAARPPFRTSRKSLCQNGPACAAVVRDHFCRKYLVLAVLRLQLDCLQRLANVLRSTQLMRTAAGTWQQQQSTFGRG